MSMCVGSAQPSAYVEGTCSVVQLRVIPPNSGFYASFLRESLSPFVVGEFLEVVVYVLQGPTSDEDWWVERKDTEVATHCSNVVIPRRRDEGASSHRPSIACLISVSSIRHLFARR